MVISSQSEGGANVVSEAVVAGVPVLASRIDGNVGLEELGLLLLMLAVLAGRQTLEQLLGGLLMRHEGRRHQMSGLRAFS